MIFWCISSLWSSMVLGTGAFQRQPACSECWEYLEGQKHAPSCTLYSSSALQKWSLKQPVLTVMPCPRAAALCFPFPVLPSEENLALNGLSRTAESPVAGRGISGSSNPGGSSLGIAWSDSA